MTPHSSQPHVRPRGFAIVSAIFILVVLGALGAFIVSVSTNQHVGSALDIQGVRAYHAARAGIEWGIYRVRSTAAYNFSYGPGPGPVGTASPNTRACPASPTSFVPAAPTLGGFTITVTCLALLDPSGGPTTYTIVSTACNRPAAGACPNITNPGTDYIERRLEVEL
jgi:MSHA biogenesis protein MshP